MDIITEGWLDFLYEAEQEADQELLQELSPETTETQDEWIVDNGPAITQNFKELFGDALRIVIPGASDDDRKALAIVTALRRQEWAPSLPDAGIGYRTFKTKSVQQRNAILGAPADPADRGPEHYEIKTVAVAKLDLERKTTRVIPAGPRKGETIEKTEKTTMGRAIALLVKRGEIDKSLLDWWTKIQTLYTKKYNWEPLEQMFADIWDAGKYSVVISRAPRDILRMSDIGAIKSCHSEGDSHFKCAISEAKATGLLAYFVETNELNAFLNGKTDKHRAQKFVETFILVPRAVFEAFEPLDTLEETEVMLDSLKESVRTLIESLPGGPYATRAEREKKAFWAESVLNAVTPKMVRRAIESKLNHDPWPPLDTGKPDRPISDFDKKELFRDPMRDVKGISAVERVRLRKFVDEGGVEFAVPEIRTYGAEIPGFLNIVKDWAWEKQKHLFVGADEKLQIPEAKNLVRYGGSYEDNKDGMILNHFFDMAKLSYDPYFAWLSVKRISPGEDDRLDEYTNATNDMVAAALNKAKYVYFTVEVEMLDAGRITITADASARFRFDLGWKGSMEIDGDETHIITPSDSLVTTWASYAFPEDSREIEVIPAAYHASYRGEGYFAEKGRFFNPVLKIFDEYPEHSEYSLDKVDNILEMVFNWTCGDCRIPDNVDDYFNYYLNSIDDKYEEIHEQIRRHLVEENYVASTPFDAILEAENLDHTDKAVKLKYFDVFGADKDADDYDAEIYFVFKEPRGVRYTGPGFLYDMETGVKWPFAIETLPPEMVFGTWAIEKRVGVRDFIIVGADFLAEVSREIDVLRKAAYEHANAQLELDFGEKYRHMRPKFKGIAFDEDMEIKFHVSPATKEFFFHLKLTVTPTQNQMDVDGIFKFMEFIDEHPREIIAAVATVLKGRVQKVVKEREAPPEVDQEQLRLDSEGLIEKITANFVEIRQIQQQNLDIDPAEEEALDNAEYGLEWIEENWDSMDVIEKQTALENYLRPMENGSLGIANVFDPATGLLKFWNEMVRQRYVSGGRAPEAEFYRWGATRGHTWDASADIMEMTSLIGLPLEEQTIRLERLLAEVRQAIDLRIYKVEIGCAIDLRIAGRDSQIENQIRGIEGVTTKSGPDTSYRVYEIKFELTGLQPRDTYRDHILVPGIASDVRGVSVKNRGQVTLAGPQLKEYGRQGAVHSPPPKHVPTMVTPRVNIEDTMKDWAEGGVQIYDAPMNTNQMRYHVMTPVEELWPYCNRYYRGTKAEFDSDYESFIKAGAQAPVYVALGQNGRVKLTGNEDLVWFAKKAGVKELPVFFSYQRQV